MRNSDLVNILKVLNKKQIKLLRKFLSSPYFNENQKIVDLFEYVIKFKPHYKADALDKRVVFEVFFPDKDFNKNSGLPLRRLMSQLMKLIEKFIEQESLENTVAQPYLTINSLDFYSLNGLEKHFQRLLSTFDKEAKAYYPFFSIGHYEIQYFKSIAAFDFYSSRSGPESGKALKAAVENLDVYYLLAKLHLICLSLSLRKVIRLDDLTSELDDFLGRIKAGPYLEIPFIEIYYHGVHILRDSDCQSNFERFKVLLAEYGEQFPVYELRQLYIYAKNFCMAHTKKGDYRYYKDLFDLFKIELEKEIIYADGKLLPNYFMIIVMVALVEKEFDWTRTFLANHQDKILGDNPEEIYQFNLAQLAFAEKDFEKALDLLRDTNFSDVVLRLETKRLVIKIYYETDEVLLLNSAMSAFKVAIHRDKLIAPIHQERNKNFINFLFRLVNTAPKDYKRIEKLVTTIQEEKKISERIWLTEVLEGMRA